MNHLILKTMDVTKYRGIWLDRGELDKLIERPALPAAPGERVQGSSSS